MGLRIFVVLAAILVILAASQWNSLTPTTATHRRTAFWNALRVNGNEVEGYDSLMAMKDAADVVVVGRLSNFRMSRQIQGDAVEDVVTYAVADLFVDDLVSGNIAKSPVLLEFLITDPPSRASATIDEIAELVPTDDTLFFLRNKGGSEARYFRLVNSQGAWTTSDTGIAAPLADDSSELPSAKARYADELAEVASLDELVDRLR